MKKIFALLLIIASFAFTAHAQNSDTSWRHKMKGDHKNDTSWHHKMGYNRYHHHEGMEMSQLNLSEDQKKQLKANNEAFRKQEQELNKNENITVKEFRDKQYALRQERKAKFESLLTPEQKEKFKQMKLQQQQEHEKMAAKQLDRMKVKLGLSDDQVAQIKAQQKEEHHKMMAIRDNNNLSRTDKKEQLEAIRTQQKESFKKILSPDQLNQMEEMRKDRKDWNSGNSNY